MERNFIQNYYGFNCLQKQQENAMRCSNRDDLFQPSFTLKISIFSEAYKPS